MLKASTDLPSRVLALCIHAGVLLVLGFFCWMLADLIFNGLHQLSWEFLVTEPENSGRSGGIAPMLVSTLLILSVALTATCPLGLATAIWLSEFNRSGSQHHARIVQLSLDVLTGVPSIVFGLFGNAFFCVFLGMGFSILSGGLTLACMMLPIFIRAAESGLSAVPDDWRRGGAALGISKAAVLWHVLLPAAMPTITAGLMLGISRAMAETAALIFTSGYVDKFPQSLLDSGRALSVHIYDLSMNVTGGDGAAYRSVLVLVGLLITINSIAYFLSDKLFSKRITAP